MIGLNVLSSGLSQINTYDVKTTLVNGSAYPPPSGVILDNEYPETIPFCANTSEIGRAHV